MEGIKEIEVRGAEEDKLRLGIDANPEVVLKEEVGQRLDEGWADSVISSMGFQWFQIRKEGNRIIVEPVNVVPIE